MQGSFSPTQATLSSRKRKRCDNVESWLGDNKQLVQQLKKCLQTTHVSFVRGGLMYASKETFAWVQNVIVRTTLPESDFEDIIESISVLSKLFTAFDSVLLRSCPDDTLPCVSVDYYTRVLIHELANLAIQEPSSSNSFLTCLCVFFPCVREYIDTLHDDKYCAGKLLDYEAHLDIMCRAYTTCCNVSLCLVYGTKQVYFNWKQLLLLCHQVEQIRVLSLQLEFFYVTCAKMASVLEQKSATETIVKHQCVFHVRCCDDLKQLLAVCTFRCEPAQGTLQDLILSVSDRLPLHVMLSSGQWNVRNVVQSFVGASFAGLVRKHTDKLRNALNPQNQSTEGSVEGDGQDTGSACNAYQQWKDNQALISGDVPVGGGAPVAGVGDVQEGDAVEAAGHVSDDENGNTHGTTPTPQDDAKNGTFARLYLRPVPAQILPPPQVSATTTATKTAATTSASLPISKALELDAYYAKLVRGASMTVQLNVVWTPDNESMYSSVDQQMYTELVWKYVSTMFMGIIPNHSRGSEVALGKLLDIEEGKQLNAAEIETYLSEIFPVTLNAGNVARHLGHVRQVLRSYSLLVVITIYIDQFVTFVRYCVHTPC